MDLYSKANDQKKLQSKEKDKLEDELKKLQEQQMENEKDKVLIARTLKLILKLLTILSSLTLFKPGGGSSELEEILQELECIKVSLGNYTLKKGIVTPRPRVNQRAKGANLDTQSGYGQAMKRAIAHISGIWTRFKGTDESQSKEEEDKNLSHAFMDHIYSSIFPRLNSEDCDEQEPSSSNHEAKSPIPSVSSAPAVPVPGPSSSSQLTPRKNINRAGKDALAREKATRKPSRVSKRTSRPSSAKDKTKGKADKKSLKKTQLKKKFQCKDCNFASNYKVHLERHISTKHSDLEKEIHPCDYCEDCFTTGSALTAHFMRRHLN